jgi:hypothetical protein
MNSLRKDCISESGASAVRAGARFLARRVFNLYPLYLIILGVLAVWADSSGDLIWSPAIFQCMRSCCIPFFRGTLVTIMHPSGFWRYCFSFTACIPAVDIHAPFWNSNPAGVSVGCGPCLASWGNRSFWRTLAVVGSACSWI